MRGLTDRPGTEVQPAYCETWTPSHKRSKSNEAKAAFERGGGGKRAEAVRLLAAAKHAGKAPEAKQAGKEVQWAEPVRLHHCSLSKSYEA
eukprot:1158507-Pelagomonas_calceolata.AAC.10